MWNVIEHSAKYNAHSYIWSGVPEAGINGRDK